MAIQVFDPKQVIEAPIVTGQDANALMAPGRALAGLGANVQQAAKQLEQFAQQKQHAENVSKLHNADRAMKESFADFQVEMAKQGDETKWGEMWDKHWSSTRKVLQTTDGSEHSPAVNEALNIKFADFSSQKSIEIKGLQTKRAIQRSKAKTETAVEYDLEHGDLEGATRKIQEGQAAGLYSPLEAQKRIEGAQSRAEHYQVMSLIQEDPESAYENLKEKTEGGKQWKQFKNLDAATRNSLMGHARRESGKAQSEFYAELTFQTAKEGPATVDEINEMVDNGHITKGQGSAYIREFHSPELHKLDPGKMAEALRAIEDYNPADDPFFEQYAQLHAAVFTMPSKQSTQLATRLKQKLDKGPGKTETADVVMKRLGSMFTDDFFTGGKKPKGTEQIGAANVAYLEMAEEAQQLITKNPDLPASEIMKKLFEAPAAAKPIAAKARELNQSFSTVDPTQAQKDEAFGQSLLIAFQGQFPGITADMDEREMIIAASAGGPLTPQQVANLKKLHRKLNAGR